MKREPCQPAGDEVIYRYMSREHFLDIFERFDDHAAWELDDREIIFRNQDVGRMWFSYPHSFEDDWEARLPSINESTEDYCRRMAERNNLDEEQAAIRLHRMLSHDMETIRCCNKIMAGLCGVSCWSTTPPSNKMMWDFAGGPSGVAIRSTVDRVLSSLGFAHGSLAKKSRVKATEVGYVDHTHWLLEQDGYRNILACVNVEHSSENEIRFVADSSYIYKIQERLPRQYPSPDSAQTVEEAKMELFKQALQQAKAANEKCRSFGLDGFRLPINLEMHVNGVVFPDQTEVSLIEAKKRVEEITR